MKKYTVHLRYYIGDPLTETRKEDLDRIGKTHGVDISFEKIDNRTFDNGIMKEETLGKAIEEITQDVITVVSGDENPFREAILAIYERYRSPRTVYGFWGSSKGGEQIAKEIAEETGGGW